MKKKTVLIIGILTTIMVIGAIAALAQNSSEKKKDTENHKCTPEMMNNMSKNCPDQIMKSGEGENMMNDTAGKNHCEDMDSGMGSMMSSSGSVMKRMM